MVVAVVVVVAAVAVPTVTAVAAVAPAAPVIVVTVAVPTVVVAAVSVATAVPVVRVPVIVVVPAVATIVAVVRVTVVIVAAVSTVVAVVSVVLLAAAIVVVATLPLLLTGAVAARPSGGGAGLVVPVVVIVVVASGSVLPLVTAPAAAVAIPVVVAGTVAPAVIPVLFTGIRCVARVPLGFRCGFLGSDRGGGHSAPAACATGRLRILLHLLGRRSACGGLLLLAASTADGLDEVALPLAGNTPDAEFLCHLAQLSELERGKILVGVVRFGHESPFNRCTGTVGVAHNWAEVAAGSFSRKMSVLAEPTNSGPPHEGCPRIRRERMKLCLGLVWVLRSGLPCGHTAWPRHGSRVTESGFENPGPSSVRPWEGVRETVLTDDPALHLAPGGHTVLTCRFNPPL